MNTTRHTTNLLIETQAKAMPWSKIFAIATAVLIGTFILAVTSFAGSELLHNAAHDIRHGLAFPCH